MSMPPGNIYSNMKNSNYILLYLLNPSFPYDIILTEAPFPQFSIV